MRRLVTIAIILGVSFAAFQYYQKIQKSSFPSAFVESRTNFSKSIQLLRESSAMSQPQDQSGKPFSIPKEQENAMYRKIEEGIRLSEGIDDNYLDYLDPQLKMYYRNKLILGTKTFYDGIKLNNTGNVVAGLSKQMDGNKLIVEWITWWESNNNRIANKAYPE